MTSPDVGARSFDRLWADLEPLGRDPRSGGYRRFAWTREDAALREWFTGAARDRGLDVTTDRAGNLWAWWGDVDRAVAAGRRGLVLGSHLDSVPDGGAFDGPLGVVSSFAALDALRDNGWTPDRPVGIAAFSDEEGARFGVACAGSRILTGALDADRARSLRDESGTTMAEAMTAAGHDPTRLGRDDETLRRIGQFVELHVEQGRGLAGDGATAAVGVASSIWPHGRWRLDLTGRADHAGTTRLEDRADPMLALAATVLAARDAAERHGTVATVGKVRVEPNGVNAIPSAVTAWLDARGEEQDAVRAVVAQVAAAAGTDAVEESWTASTPFDAGLRDHLAHLLGSERADGGAAGGGAVGGGAAEGGAAGGGAPDGDVTPAPVLATGAGHDAGVLQAAGVQTAMLFVRNPTGVSHSPHEHAERSDCHAGVRALTRVLRVMA